MSSEDQAAAYLTEAELTLQSARTIYQSATETRAELWAQVVKNGYDAIEQAVSAAIAAADEAIPRNHPGKIDMFLALYAVPDELEATLLDWLRRRSDSQYVDVRGDEINVPHKTFEQEDAEQILADAEHVIAFVTKQLEIDL